MDQKEIFGGTAAEGPVTSAQMKEIEKKADEAGLSYYQMMENAGTGASEQILSEQPVKEKKVLIFCGKGNNGGDGFVAARKLTEAGASVQLILTEGEPRTDDAVKNWQRCIARGIPSIDLSEIYGGENPEKPEPKIGAFLKEADLIVDAIYGTGFHGGLREPVRSIAQMINRSEAAVYALDIPSGLNSDTGEADEDVIRADCTIAFHRLKPAHIRKECMAYCGRSVCISIGIEEVLK